MRTTCRNTGADRIPKDGIGDGITMIVELGSPFSGLVRVSAEPMSQALAQIML